MHRCADQAPPNGASRRLVLSFMGASCLLAALPAGASLNRRFPRNALRGEIVFTAYPEIVLNGKPARLSPGGRVRDTANMNALPTALAGNRAIVHYTVDSMGFVNEAWVLTREEIDRLWPRSPQEAAAWAFDEPSQTWSKP
jgi:hypothetical protein